MKNVIPIFYTIDENYAPFFSVSLDSLIDHVSDNNVYHINVICEGLKEETIEILKNQETDNVKITITDIEDKITPIREKLSKQASKTHFPISVYFRMFIPLLYPEYDKGIYIDSDTILNDDIAKLYAYDLKDNLLGGIFDSSIIDIPIFSEYIEKADGVSRYDYINSGVLLINLKKMRDINFDNHFLYLLNKYDFEVVAPDQDYINAMCLGNILHLDEKWNVMPVEGKEEIDNPSLIHYNLFLKPWHYDAPYDTYFWEYAEKSVFYEQIKGIKDNFTDEDKRKDKEIMEAMLNQAQRISENEVTFKSIFESGAESRL